MEIIKSKNDWDAVLQSITQYDFYHTYDYHLLSKNKEEEPVLLVYRQDKTIIALPLLFRRIENSAYKDATSVYGYSGPICQNVTPNFDNLNFKIELNDILRSNKIISVFSRLNPFITFQDFILKDIGEISSPGKIVNIDIQKNLEGQKKEYQKRLKTYINKARKTCVVKNGNTNEDIATFIELYYQNMKRVNATLYYFFKEKYFYDFFNSNDFKTQLLLAVHNKNNDIIAGAMFIIKNGIVQYHLSGAKEGYLELNPVKLLIDEMRVKATKDGFKYFNLGGGLGSKEDSLFKFKSHFSKNHIDFKLWKYVVNPNTYDKLTLEKTSLINDEKYVNFFPKYRVKIENS